MNFDAIIIGGGLAGLTCGIRLAAQGLRCAIVSRGQSALHFSSGSLDLLSTLPDGSEVRQPAAALSSLTAQAPDHPYSLLGAENVIDLARESEQLLSRCALRLHGSYQQNHRRMTPLGTGRASWLSPEYVPQLPLPWQRVTVINIAGLLDFPGEMVAASLNESGVSAHLAELSLPLLDKLRNNPSEFRAVNIAQVLDNPEYRRQLIAELRLLIRGGEALILPACLGLEDNTIPQQLTQELGLPVKLLPTLPPSVPGMHLHHQLRRRFLTLGGLIMPGDAITHARVEQQHVTALFTRNHREVPLRARYSVLASGSFFSKGLNASRGEVSEPIFGLDMLATGAPSEWSQQDFFAPQPWLQFGVAVDRQLRPSVNGERLQNLYAIGSVLGGYDPIRQGCGGGVSMLTALFAARQIINAGEKTS